MERQSCIDWIVPRRRWTSKHKYKHQCQWPRERLSIAQRLGKLGLLKASMLRAICLYYQVQKPHHLQTRWQEQVDLMLRLRGLDPGC